MTHILKSKDNLGSRHDTGLSRGWQHPKTRDKVTAVERRGPIITQHPGRHPYSQGSEMLRIMLEFLFRNWS